MYEIIVAMDEEELEDEETGVFVIFDDETKQLVLAEDESGLF